MNVIDGQAGLVIYSSLIFYSLTINNILNIIVLLILAGVSIATLTGQNGILTQANTAKTQTAEAKDLEQVKLAVSTGVSENLTTGRNVNEAIQEELRKTDPAATVVGDGDEKEITYNGKLYNVNVQTGEITENNIDQSGIFTYTNDGYITGIKEEYYYWLDEESASNDIKIASLSNIQIAGIVHPRSRALVDEIGTTLYIPNKIGDITIVGIYENAFSSIINLEKVILPATIKELGDYSFYFCDNLKNVDTKEGITKFGASTFAFCDINSIYIPDTTKEIGNKCFENCFQATEEVGRLFIPSGVEVMGQDVFAGMNAPREKNIYCGANEKPDGWDEDWVQSNHSYPGPNIVWGATRN